MSTQPATEPAVSSSTGDAATIHCLNGHELRRDQEKSCPICGEPSAALVSAERREGMKYILPGIALLVGPWVVAFKIGESGGMTGGGQIFLVIVLLFLVIGGVGMTIGAVNSLVRAPRLVKNAIRKSAEPQPLLKFPCPNCSALNEGPFQDPAPACADCGTRVLGVICWRCGELQAQRAFEADAPRPIYRCTSCGQEQAMPVAETSVQWWR